MVLGDMVVLKVVSSDPIQNLKQQLKEETGYAIEKQCLTYRKQKLIGNTPIEDYGLMDGCTIQFDLEN
jgi:hypothetical protein